MVHSLDSQLSYFPFPVDERQFTVPANYGSEALFIAVAKRLGMKIHVKDAAYNVYKNIAEIKDAVTDDPLCTKIHACQSCVSVVIL